MPPRQQWAVVGGVVLALALGLAAATRFLGEELSQVTVGSAAPNFSAATLDDETPARRTLADYRGQVVLLNIWATWCEPCKIEMPSMEALYRAYGRRGVHIVDVSI